MRKFHTREYIRLEDGQSVEFDDWKSYTMFRSAWTNQNVKYEKWPGKTLKARIVNHKIVVQMVDGKSGDKKQVSKRELTQDYVGQRERERSNWLLMEALSKGETIKFDDFKKYDAFRQAFMLQRRKGHFADQRLEIRTQENGAVLATFAPRNEAAKQLPLRLERASVVPQKRKNHPKIRKVAAPMPIKDANQPAIKEMIFYGLLIAVIFWLLPMLGLMALHLGWFG